MAGMTLNTSGRRVVGAISFSPDAYEELRDDPSATVYAVAVVVIATLLAAIGGLLWASIAAAPPEIFNVDVARFFQRSVVIGSIVQVALWAAWVAVTYLFLRHIYLLTDVEPRALVRTMGFAFAPMALQILLVFPVLEFPIGLIAIGATVGCTVLAVRAASGATPAQALVSTVAGFALFALALGFLGTSDSDLAPGIFALDPNSISVGLKLDR
jgi:hypothetical protein